MKSPKYAQWCKTSNRFFSQFVDCKNHRGSIRYCATCDTFTVWEYNPSLAHSRCTDCTLGYG